MSTPTSAFDFQNFYSATLTGDIASGDLVIPVDISPAISEGILVIDPDATSPEIVYFTSKGASSVTCPADGRGWDGTVATSHLQGTQIICAPVAYYFEYIKSVATTSTAGWKPLGYAPNTVTANGNRSYSLVFNGVDLTSYISNGMKLQSTRTVPAPTQVTSLNGTTQYFSKTSPAAMTFTDDFVASAWVKLTSYGTSVDIISRYNGTSGWRLNVDVAGNIRLIGYNAGSGNNSLVQSYQSIPLNRWVHVAAQLDMSTFTATTTTSYIMIDGVDVPCSVSRAGTNPTALVQAGDLQIGAGNSTAFFPGKIAQVAIYSAKVTQANIVLTYSQGLAGTETSLISAYSFNNSINDLNANANNLTANGSAVATNADSPFAQDDDGVPTASTDVAVVQDCAFSTNTTVVVQVPEGCTLPTSGGITSMQYSTEASPFGFPRDLKRWRIITFINNDTTVASPVGGTYYNPSSFRLNIPIGDMNIVGQIGIQADYGTDATRHIVGAVSTSSSSVSNNKLRGMIYNTKNGMGGTITVTDDVTLTAATIYYGLIYSDASGTNIYLLGASNSSSYIMATPNNI